MVNICSLHSKKTETWYPFGLLPCKVYWTAVIVSQADCIYSKYLSRGKKGNSSELNHGILHVLYVSSMTIVSSDSVLCILINIKHYDLYFCWIPLPLKRYLFTNTKEVKSQNRQKIAHVLFILWFLKRNVRYFFLLLLMINHLMF